jgi:hypothetical protein
LAAITGVTGRLLFQTKHLSQTQSLEEKNVLSMNNSETNNSTKKVLSFVVQRKMKSTKKET